MIDIKAAYDSNVYLKVNFDLKKARSHNKCWGRGYIGTYQNGKPYLCDCVLKPVAPAESLSRAKALGLVKKAGKK